MHDQTATEPIKGDPTDRTGPEPWKSWEEYAASYNLRTMPGLSALFTRFLIEECQKRDGNVVALDVGCGHGIGGKLERSRQVRAHVKELWGIEPDTGVDEPEGIFDNFQHALMETAKLPENHFDLVYSYTAIEHVEHPMEYMQAIARVLKPGGVHVFMTPNGRHYFAHICRVTKALRIDELILRLVRVKTVDEDHYPVQYKFNNPSQIRPVCAELGFEEPKFVFAECTGPTGYFPGPLKPILWLLMKKREIVRKPELLLELYCKMVKKA